MREIKIGGVPYTIKFSYRAAKYQNCVQAAFEILSGATVMGEVVDSENPRWSDMIKGLTKQVGVIPQLCDTFMYAGLIESENRPSCEEAAGDLLIQYLEENNKSYDEVYESFMDCMVEDGFFKKAGIEKQIEAMNESIKKQTETAKGEAEKEETAQKKKSPAKKKATATTK